MMKRILFLGLVASLAAGAAAGPGKRFDWTTTSPAAKQGLLEVQQRIESFQFGPETIAVAQKVVAADPEFAMGVYYLSAVTPPPENEKHLERAVVLSKKASDGERRFIDAMVVARANQGADFLKAIPALEQLAADYPGERLVQVILGQIYQGTDADKARAAFRRADERGGGGLRAEQHRARARLPGGEEEARELSLAPGARGLARYDSWDAMPETIILGSDHAGFDLKERVKKALERLGVPVEDVGTHSTESVDYPDYAHRVAEARRRRAATRAGSWSAAPGSASRWRPTATRACARRWRTTRRRRASAASTTTRTCSPSAAAASTTASPSGSSRCG